MTATLLGTLVEDGQLNWEQSLAELLPDLAAEMHPLWQKATLRQLLTNRAGAPASITKMDPELWSRFMRHEDDPQQQRDLLLRAVLAREPASQPGSTYLYSNAGFSMAGTVAEQIAGLPFEELMRTRLFEPLAMTSAGFGAPGEPGKMDQPWGHSANGKPVPPGRNADNPPAISPAGRVHLTLSDWARYIQIHLRGAAGDTDLLSQVTFRELHRPPANAEPAYAMGWDITDEAGPEVRVLVHNGSNTMWFAMAWVALERDLGVIVVTNQGDQDDAVDDTLWNLVVDAVERR